MALFRHEVRGPSAPNSLIAVLSCFVDQYRLCFAFLPLTILKSIFPPVVTSITVILIGVALTGTGMKYWGGGAVCADMVWKEHSAIANSQVEIDPLKDFGNPSYLCFNGDVALGYGHAEFIGLGVSVMVMLVLIELFGSVFMKYVS